MDGNYTDLHLYNTMSRSKEIFRPLEAGRVRIFTCGPSIYQRPHVGNYRTFLFEDVLVRYLEYRGLHVDRIINFTDVEDKAIAEAEKEGKTLQDLTGRAGDRFFEDAALLRLKLPEVIPRSSTTVDEAVRLIQILLDKGYAYWDKGDVFFQPLKFAGFGKLFRLDMSRWPKTTRRFRKDTYPGVRWNLGDFILWHGCKPGETIYWETVIGRGRPAWNIQDPAIISQYLGFRIDIHCGGSDNIYRHHDYNIAVMESVSGEELAPFWLHGEHLLLDGKKMSKSLGNIVYVDDLAAKGAKPEHIRFYLIYGWHREKLNLTQSDFDAKAAKLDNFRGMVGDLLSGYSGSEENAATVEELISGMTQGFESAMNDALHVGRAFDSLYESVSKLSSLKKDGRLAEKDGKRIESDLRRIDGVLQMIFPQA
ncbi:MAG: class I tRNA ligase family protein [Syntrophobacteraceae bacterium]